MASESVPIRVGFHGHCEAPAPPARPKQSRGEPRRGEIATPRWIAARNDTCAGTTRISASRYYRRGPASTCLCKVSVASAARDQVKIVRLASLRFRPISSCSRSLVSSLIMASANGPGCPGGERGGRSAHPSRPASKRPRCLRRRLCRRSWPPGERRSASRSDTASPQHRPPGRIRPLPPAVCSEAPDARMGER